MINDVPWSFTFFCQDRLKMIPARARASFSLFAYVSRQIIKIDRWTSLRTFHVHGGRNDDTGDSRVERDARNACIAVPVTRIPSVRQLATTDRQIHGSRVVRSKKQRKKRELWTCVYTREYTQPRPTRRYWRQKKKSQFFSSFLHVCAKRVCMWVFFF